jgi:DNA-binding MarR family transcriptional regulator
VWYNITENLIISYVPIIGITNKTAISNRLVKLEDYKLIERNPKNSPGRKKYLRLGSNAHKLTFCEHK